MRRPLDELMLLICGHPATGKSTFCRFLAESHGFAHFDMERYPQGWPDPDLHTVWEESRVEFVREVRLRHDRAAIDWGFPPRYLAWAIELRDAGAIPIWFGADEERAREAFVTRGRGSPEAFNLQMRAIKSAGLPGALRSQVVQAFDEAGFRSPESIRQEIVG